jgi:PAS domain S-box-containing protein
MKACPWYPDEFMVAKHEPDIGTLRSSIEPRDADRDGRSAALRRALADLVLETTCEGIWLIDADARTTFVNRHAADLLGYTEDEMIGKRIFEFMDEERRPIAQRNLLRRQQGMSERNEVKLRRKDGSPVWVIGSANPVFDRRGDYAGALAVLGDLTTQKDTEARLRKEVTQLQDALAARSAHGHDAETADADGSEARGFGMGSIFAVSLMCGTFLGVVALATFGGIATALLPCDVSLSSCDDEGSYRR